MTRSIIHFALILTLSICLNACVKDKCKNHYTYVAYTPVYTAQLTIRQSTPTFQAPRAMKQPGKIWMYGAYIFINELKKGFHIIDNTNPSSPRTIGFFPVEGNVDIAVKDGILYADNYMDIIAIDVRHPEQAKFLNRVNDVFPFKFPADNKGNVLVDYKKDTVSLDIDCNDPKYSSGYFYTGGIFYSCAACDKAGAVTTVASQSNPTAANIPSAGGSLSRFGITQNYLYALDNYSLHIISIQQPEAPVLKKDAAADFGWGRLETLFPYKDKLFIGSDMGMRIYDNSKPETPTLLANFAHADACDPVVANDTRAYVTLHHGDNCHHALDVLQVVDITNLSAPTLIKQYPMTSPMGLSVVDNKLYLCDDGLKIFDATDDSSIDQHLLSQVKNLPAQDVIYYTTPDNHKNLLIITSDGLHQYDVTNPATPKNLSTISIKN